MIVMIAAHRRLSCGGAFAGCMTAAVDPTHATQQLNCWAAYGGTTHARHTVTIPQRALL
jgi:hypothetical protein